MKVIGVGLGRTGTMSLQLALETLGYDKCFHMVELLKMPERLKYLKAFHKTGKMDWDNYLEGCQSTVDYPNCLFYKELYQKYPAAKFILTVRDPEKWYESVNATIYRTKPKKFTDFLNLLKVMAFSKDLRQCVPIFMHMDKLIWNGQFAGKFEDKKATIQAYHAHIEDVKNTIPKEQLLIYEVKEGWNPLCEFLGDSIPNQEFPRANSQEELNRKMDKLLYDGILEF